MGAEVREYINNLNIPTLQMRGDGMTEKRSATDILTRKELSDLVHQHVAIRSQMRFLIKGLNNISIQSNRETALSTNLNEQISLYRYSLDDFQEALRRHNQLSRRIEMLCGAVFNKELVIEQKEIEKQLDNIVWIAHNAAYHELQPDELIRCVSDIVAGVNKICESIDVHMAKRERAFKYLWG